MSDVGKKNPVEDIVSAGDQGRVVEFPDEAGRIEAYLRGDSKVFTEVDGWIRAEMRARYPRLQSEHEDLCQSVHGKLVTNLREGRFQGRSSLRTYVTGIAHYTAIDRLRELYQQRALAQDILAEPRPESVNPYDTTDLRDEGKLLHQVLQALPQGCRELWRLVFVEKLPYDKISEKLAIPAGTVKSRMWHCRKKAAELYQRLDRRPRSPSTS